MSKELVMEVFSKALKYKTPLPGRMMYIDREGQYCSFPCQEMVGKAGMRATRKSW